MIERLYRLLLPLAPREFRERFGPELLETAREIDRTRRRHPRRLVRAVWDAIATPFALRAEVRRDANRARLATPHRQRTRPVDSLLRDLQYAWRGLRRAPAFTAFVAVTLALGIGANAAMFGIADRLLLRGPDHVQDSRRVVRLYMTEQPAGMRAFTTDGFGYVSYDLLRRNSQTFEQVATYAINEGLGGQGSDAREITVGYGSAGLFPLLGVQAARGRFFSEQEDAANAAARVAVLSHAAWTAWFGGSPDVLGQSVVIGDESYAVIGVSPRGFTGPELRRVDVWLPANLLGPRITTDWMTGWNAQWLRIVARLKPDVTFAQASQDATAVHQRGYTDTEASTREARLTVASLRADEHGVDATEIRVLRWLTGVAALVLLIACANVANLLLARGIRRGREVAIRAALGAGGFRIVRLMLMESLLLALFGGVLGLIVASLVGAAARQVLFSTVDWTSSPVDARVLLISLAVAVATGLIIGAVPAFLAIRGNFANALKTGARDGGGRRSRLRTTLTIAQAAVSVVLLVGAGLFVRSLWNVHALDLGVDADRVLVVEVIRPTLARFPAGPSRDTERARRRTFYQDALPRVRALPGVEQASVAVGTPFGNRFQVRLRVPGQTESPRLPSGGASISAVTAGYFETVGTAILRGRAFTTQEGAGTEPITIVSETMARTVWPEADAIGQCLFIGADTPPCTRVVGIAENTRRSRLREDPVMHYYIPGGQEVGIGGSSLLIRTQDPTGAVAADVRTLLAGLDTTISYVNTETFQDRIDPQIRPWRIGASVFLLSGVLALIVAGIGIYSVMSYLIADRRREIGVRMALGADAGQIVRLVFRGSVVMAVVGVLVGEAMAAALGRFVEPLLFDVSPRDPAVFLSVGGVIVFVALAATLMPARRARLVSPVEALRAE